MQFMKRPHNRTLTKLSIGLGLLLVLEAPGMLLGEPPPAAALTAFDSYTTALEARLARQHRTPADFLSPWPAANNQLQPTLEPLSPAPASMPPGALLHHWRATLFVPGANAAAFEQLLRNFAAYPRIFAPEVLAARTLTSSPTHGSPAHIQASLRVRQHHVLTVVLDPTYDATFSHIAPAHGASSSRSVHVAEVAAPGTPAEHPLTPADDHGFLWRQNTYWSWAELPAGPDSRAGLALQVESVSLTRAIPAGLGWAVRPYLESIPRESLTFTLRAAAAALTQQQTERATR